MVYISFGVSVPLCTCFNIVLNEKACCGHCMALCKHQHRFSLVFCTINQTQPICRWGTLLQCGGRNVCLCVCGGGHLFEDTYANYEIYGVLYTSVSLIIILLQNSNNSASTLYKFRKQCSNLLCKCPLPEGSSSVLSLHIL